MTPQCHGNTSMVSLERPATFFEEVRRPMRAALTSPERLPPSLPRKAVAVAEAEGEAEEQAEADVLLACASIVESCEASELLLTEPKSSFWFEDDAEDPTFVWIEGPQSSLAKVFSHESQASSASSVSSASSTSSAFSTTSVSIKKGTECKRPISSDSAPMVS